MSLHDRHYRVEFSSSFASKSRTLTSGHDFRLDFDAPGRYFIGDLPPRLVDLLRIGEAIFVVDRLVRRRRGGSGSWGRALQLKVELLEPDFWSSTEVRDALQQTIEFLTDDDWEFEFLKDQARYEWSPPLLSNVFAAESPLVSLYSGGLDSAAGLGRRLSECPDRLVLPVTVNHQPGQPDLVGKQFQRLKARFGPRIDPLIVRSHMPRPDGVKWEPSHRGRSFLFASAGVVAATFAGVSQVEVFESDIGAINIPLMAGTIGSKTTRGCHPEFLRRMSRLASLVSGRQIDIHLPFFTSTKGEMVCSLKEAGLADLACETISCASYPLGYHRYKQCGLCPGCVFRRQAMMVGDIDEPPGTYSFDLFRRTERIRPIPPEKLNSLKAFLMQVAGWSDIETTKRLPGAVERHLRQTRILKPSESPEPIIALLARYRDEWLAIAADGRRRGLPWARLLERNLVGQGVTHAIA